MTVSTTTPRRLAQAIRRAEAILPGEEAASGKRDPRWQAIIRIGAFIETHPEPVWEFALKWGKHADADLRTAVACCLLEHLLEHHFELVFPRAERAAHKSKRFADALCRCSLFGQSLEAENAARLLRLRFWLRWGKDWARSSRRRSDFKEDAARYGFVVYGPASRTVKRRVGS